MTNRFGTVGGDIDGDAIPLDEKMVELAGITNSPAFKDIGLISCILDKAKQYTMMLIVEGQVDNINSIGVNKDGDRCSIVISVVVSDSDTMGEIVSRQQEVIREMGYGEFAYKAEANVLTMSVTFEEGR